MSERYLLGSEGVLLFAKESTPYTAETTDFLEFGYTNEDIDPPNENPHTPMPTGGHDGPYINSEDPREHEFDATTVPVDDTAPLELALGERTTGSELDPDYEFATFTSSRPLPTATIRHIQSDANLQVDYVGCKASLNITWSMGDPVNFNYSITAARQEEPEAASAFTSSIDDTVQPYKAHMQGTVTATDNDGFTREIATVTGGDIGVDNGLEVNHHGEGREGYSVSEETNAERYTDQTLDFKPTDKELYERCATNDVPVDVEVPFVRQESAGTITDGIILRIKNTPIVDAPMPYQIEGSLDATMTLQPTDFEVEIRTPL